MPFRVTHSLTRLRGSRVASHVLILESTVPQCPNPAYCVTACWTNCVIQVPTAVAVYKLLPVFVVAAVFPGEDGGPETRVAVS